MNFEPAVMRKLERWSKEENEEETEDGIRVSFFGDSITTYKDYSGTQGYCYDESMLPVESTWWMRLLGEEQWILGVNESIGGTRVTWDGVTEDEKQFIGNEWYLGSEERIVNLGSNGIPDKIFVFAGMNDILFQGEVDMGEIKEEYIYGKTDDFADAYYTMLQRIRNDYPDAEVVCMIPYHTIYSAALPVLLEDTEKEAAIIEDICEKERITAIDLREVGLVGDEDMETRDYIHPNESGMKKIADFIYDSIQLRHGIVEKGGGYYFYDENGRMVRNSRIEYEGSMYYFKSDGTPMKDRLTYHPDGEHIIYMDANGAMEQHGLFRFANGRDLGYANADGTLMHSGFSYDPYGRIIFFHWNGMIARGLISDGNIYYNMDGADGHYLGQFR